MKKIYLFIFAVACFHLAKATNPVPNSSFENWTSGAPDNWTTDNLFSYDPITQTTPGNTGNYAAKGQPAVLLTDTLPPELSCTGSGGYGFPVTQAYNNLGFYYKTNLAGGDLMLIVVFVYASDSSIIGSGIDSITSNASGFTNKNVAITYSGGTNAASATIEFFIAPASGTLHLASYFIVDDVSLSGLTGVNEIAGLSVSYSLFPNPVSDNLNLDVNSTVKQGFEIKLLNAMGEAVSASILYEGDKGDNKYKINVQNLPQGVYFARILMDGVLPSTRQFIVSK